MAKRKIPTELWKRFDASSLKAKSAKLYKAMKLANEQAAIAREAFNTSFRADLVANGKAEDVAYIAIGHNFGQLSYAVAEWPVAAKGASQELDSF